MSKANPAVYEEFTFTVTEKEILPTSVKFDATPDKAEVGGKYRQRTEDYGQEHRLGSNFSRHKQGKREGNEYYRSGIYISSITEVPLQVILRKFIVDALDAFYPGQTVL